MGDKKRNNTTDNLGLGEISTIRNILMGQQMSEYEQRFGHLEDKLIAASGEQGEKLTNFEGATSEKFSTLEQDINKRFDALELLLKDGIDRLQSQMQETRSNDNESLGKMFLEIGNHLLKK